MSAFFEGRESSSPYIDYIWRGYVEQDNSPVCPADSRWNLLFTTYDDQIRVSAEGATTHFVPKTQSEGAEFLVIKFQHGVFLPVLPASNLTNGDAFLPEASDQSFWLNGFSWQYPDFDNVETFVDRLIRHDVLVIDPLVEATIRGRTPGWSSRTIRRRFLQATGLTPKMIDQIVRAQKAAALLEQGVSILDTVYDAGYADQPHLTRSLKRFIGQTPAQIARASVTS